ncbi:hypothetical protein RIF29_22827 [Crotalaria pallida]|uniref:FBD domain-containing protein n=1 Tax=Crotalaria pallida TaxID=3830 RepID=A0AAN9F729_CROPI
MRGGVSLPKDASLDPLPICFMEHLKKVAIYGLHGYSVEELLAIKFLLREATVLEELNVFSASLPKERVGKVRKQIFIPYSLIEIKILKTAVISCSRKLECMILGIAYGFVCFAK